MLLKSVKNCLSDFLLIADTNTKEKIPNWRISALRIIIITVTILCLLVVGHISGPAISLNLAYSIIISASFAALLVFMLVISRKYYLLCAHLFLLSIISASVCVNLFVVDVNLAKLGSMYMYACPTVALILLGGRTALAYAVLNIIPFWLTVNSVDFTHLLNKPGAIPHAEWYITGVIFAFYNVCIPLSVARATVAAKRLNQSITQSNQYLKEKNELYRTFFSDSYEPKVITDENGNVIDFNEKAKEKLGFGTKGLSRNCNLKSIFSSLEESPDCSDDFSKLIKAKNHFYRVARQVVPNSKFLVYNFSDCTKEHSIQKELSSLGKKVQQFRFIDSQTNLPNEDWFEKHGDNLIRHKPKGFYVVVAQSDNDDYLKMKYAQQYFRHIVGEAYGRLKGDFESVVLACYSGQGKLLALLDEPNGVSLENTLYKIKSRLNDGYFLNGDLVNQSFRFGVAHFPKDGDTISEAISYAKLALDHKSVQDEINYYNQEGSQLFLKKYEIAMLLDEAIQNAELDVYYQPKVTKNGDCIGLEALTRWNHPTLGNVSPATFIPIAEESRLICQLTNLVLRKVCFQIQQWQHDGIEVVPVAVNFSALDFNQKEFISKLVNCLSDFDVSPHQIELELTESALEENKNRAIRTIEQLRNWGFVISIDDFGVGYSSIGRLADYPINKLKLDRSLTNQMTKSKRHYGLVKSVHSMCEVLDIECVAEGIETAEQLSIMVAMGTKEFQGFYFSKPLSAEQTVQFLKSGARVFVKQDREEKGVVHQVAG